MRRREPRLPRDRLDKLVPPAREEIVVVSPMDHMQRGSRDGGGDLFPHRERNDLVFVAVDDQRRDVDLRALRQRVVPVGAQPRRGQQREQRR